MALFSPLLSALSGSFSAGNGTLSLLSPTQNSAVKRAAAASAAVNRVQQTIEAAKFDANRQQIMAAVSLRIQGIAEGTIQPKEVWEKVAGYLTITGQPFTYSVDNAGQIDVQAQSLDDLQTVPSGQRNSYRTALTRLDEVRTAVDTLATKTGLRNRLISAVDRLGDLEAHAPAVDQWEKDFQVIKSTGRPVLIGLDPSGNLKAINQLESNFDYVADPDKRLKLQAAGRELTNILNGTSAATESWQYEVLGNKISGDDYFLDVDENNEIVVRRNKDKRGISATRPLYQQNLTGDYHIIPEFLKASREDTRIFKADWEKDAAALIQAKKPFHLDIVGDRVVVRATDFASARRLDLLDYRNGLARVGQATVNILS